MRQMIGKKIDTYYNIRYNMQNNNYHTYDKNNNKKSKDNMIIEGLDNKEKIDIVSSNYKSFNGVYADYLKCSAPNNIACAKLQTEYDAQTTKVNNLENEYNKQEKIHTDCTNLKTRCGIINTRINETQEFIDGLNKKMKGKQTEHNSFKEVTPVESTADYLKTNNIDICDNLDYSNKLDNLIDLKKTYNNNKDSTNKQISLKEQDIFNNNKDLIVSEHNIAAYEANRDKYYMHSRVNYGEAKRIKRHCWNNCGGWGWWRRCWKKCRSVPAHNAHWKNHYNNEGKKAMQRAQDEIVEIDKEKENKKKIENVGAKYNEEKLRLENNIETLNTKLENNNVYMNTLKNDCSRQMLNGINKISSDIEDKINSKQSTEVEYKDICNSKQISCDKEYAVFQPIEQNYNNEKLAQADLKNRHEICVDPYRNDCKDLYNKYRNSNKNIQISTSIVEKLQNYSDLDDTAPHAPQVHEKIKSNYKKVQGDFNKLKINEQEMNVKLNKNNSLYESPIDKHDKEIYTNLLLTAFATSLLYVVFVEM